MKESEELKVRELQNKVEQKENELTSVKLDTVIEGQENAESNAVKRSVDAESYALQRSNNAEAKAVERAEYAESTADSRAYDNECIQWRIERLWKKRLILCNICWIIIVVFFYLSIKNTIEDISKQNAEDALLMKAEIEGIKAANSIGLGWYSNELAIIATEKDEDKEAFTKMIESLPAKQKAVWDHFAAQLKKDEAKTIEHIKLEYEKEIKCEHGDSPIYGSYNN